MHYIPVHMQPYYQRLGFTKGDFPAAEAYYAEAISLPMYPALSEAEQDQVVAALGEALDEVMGDGLGEASGEGLGEAPGEAESG